MRGRVAGVDGAQRPGEQTGSECTPRGEYRVRIKIGDGCAVNSVFAARRPTGEVYSEQLARSQPQRDWIPTRIWVADRL